MNSIFDGDEQHDAHEALMCILDAISSCLRLFPNLESFSLFQGILHLSTRCYECECESTKSEQFTSLSVHGDTTMKLFECWSQPAQLIGENKYYCERCTHMNEASQMPKIERAPRVLIVQLKRFASK